MISSAVERANTICTKVLMMVGYVSTLTANIVQIGRNTMILAMNGRKENGETALSIEYIFGRLIPLIEESLISKYLDKLKPTKAPK